MSGGYESTCPRCGAMLFTVGCLSCGYPAGTLRDRTAADTALADKSKDDPQLGYVRYELLAEAWDSISRLGRELFSERTRVMELERELSEAEGLIRFMLEPDLENWVTTDRIMGVQRGEVERIVAYVDAHPAARRVRAKAEVAP